jgi:dihydropteroate synthase
MTFTPNRIMGVLNVTPDSFSDGGRFTQIDAALVQVKRMLEEGAAIIDVGGESTRPGAKRVSVAEEISRTVPVISAIREQPWWTVASLRETPPEFSIDTMNAETAAEAVRAGATIINDVSGGLADPGMFEVVAQTGATYVLGHWRGHSNQMDSLNQYSDVAREVASELRLRVEAALAAGVADHQIVLDPGLGFAKDAGQNWELLANLNQIKALGFPLVIGASRKRFIASALAAVGSGSEISNDRRDVATAALTALLAAPEIYAFRVHNVLASADAFAVALALAHVGAGALAPASASAASQSRVADNPKPPFANSAKAVQG